MPDDLDTALDHIFGDSDPEEKQEEAEPESAEEEEAPVAEGESTPEEEEEETEEVEEEEEAEEPPPLLAGKYKTPEELEKAYLEAQSKLGEQGNELGELRGLREEFEELKNLMEESQAQPPAGDLPDWLDEELLEDPYKAREAAIWVAKNQPHNLDSLMDAWYEAKPRAASAFEMEVALNQQRSELEEELAPVKELPGKIEQSEQAQAAQEAFNEVWASVKAHNPDLDEFADAIVEEANTTPELAAVFHGSNAEAQQRVLSTLLNSARYRAQANAELGERLTKEASEEAKSQAKVVSATSTKGRQAPKKASPNDLILEIFDREAGFVNDDR